MHAGAAFGPTSDHVRSDAGGYLHASARTGHMVGTGRDSAAAVSPIHIRPGTAPGRSATRIVRDLGDAVATFHFDEQDDGVPYPCLSPAQQEQFVADFCTEAASLKTWSRGVNWAPAPCQDLQVFVSDDYRISRSLVPASVGRRGRMEFPAWKAVAGEAAIAHELVHVYFPNGNRLLAEGLAVFLQAEIGGNRS